MVYYNGKKMLASVVMTGENSGESVDLTEVNEKISTIQTEIEPLTETEVDTIWNESIGTDEVAKVSEMIDEKLDTFNADVVQPQAMNFRRYEISANAQFPIKRNGYYMVFCANAKLQLCKSDGTLVIPNGTSGSDGVDYVKQIQVMTATLDSEPTSSTFGVGGMFWTGSHLLTSSVTTANRKADDGAYIIGTEEYTVYEMVQGG